ncbi:hypothetical protein TNCV_403541 [Trichonephila clavipes]|nr:hypothetical protein TNCV_403541 [Trichonephila clavipes]
MYGFSRQTLGSSYLTTSNNSGASICAARRMAAMPQQLIDTLILSMGRRYETCLASLVYADKPETLDHLKDNIRRVIADIRPQMLEKVIENWTSGLDYIRASRGSPMPEIIFKM